VIELLGLADLISGFSMFGSDLDSHFPSFGGGSGGFGGSLFSSGPG